MAGSEVVSPWVRIVGGQTQIGAGASVQLGASCRVEVDYTVDGVDAEAVAEWLEKSSRFFGDEQIEKLRGDFASGYLARGMLGALGFVLGEGDYRRYQDARDAVLEAGSRDQADFIESLRTLSNRALRLVSEIEVHGTSMMPTDAVVFVRIVKVYLADGSRLDFVDLSAPVAADGVRLGRGHRLRMVRREPTAASGWKVTQKRGKISGVGVSVSGAGAWAELSGRYTFSLRRMELSQAYRKLVREQHISGGVGGFFGWLGRGTNASTFKKQIEASFQQVSDSTPVDAKVNVKLMVSGIYPNVQVDASAYILVLRLTDKQGNTTIVFSNSAPGIDVGAQDENGTKLPTEDNDSTITF